MVACYVALDVFKSAGGVNITGTGSDIRLRNLIEAATRDIDSYVGRHFWSELRTYYLQDDGSYILRLPDDLVAVTTLKEDGDADATYETTWASTDYETVPYEASPTIQADRAAPYTSLEVNRRSNGTQSAFGKGQKRFELVAEWGYCRSVVDSNSNVTDNPLTASALTVNVTAGTDFDVGQTIRVESEQMYITALASNALTVTRGVNGTTAASHVNTTDIYIIQYPSPVVEAALIQAAHLLSGRNAQWSSTVGLEQTGIIQAPMRGLHPVARDLINPYRKVTV